MRALPLIAVGFALCATACNSLLGNERRPASLALDSGLSMSPQDVDSQGQGERDLDAMPSASMSDANRPNSPSDAGGRPAEGPAATAGSEAGSEEAGGGDGAAGEGAAGRGSHENQAAQGGGPAGGGAGEAGGAAADGGAAGAGSGGVSGGPGASGGGASGGSGAGGAPVHCNKREDCPRGYNCWEGSCRPAAVSCAAEKSLHPSALDALYWLAPNAAPSLAYCAMQSTTPTELCSEIEQEHTALTRDGSNLTFKLSSQLELDQNLCAIWNLRDASEGIPFAPLRSESGVPIDSCAAFGFLTTPAPASNNEDFCPYGSANGSCGYAVPATQMYCWGNYCTGCQMAGDGHYDHFVRQGYISTGFVLASADRNVAMRCNVR